MNVQFTVQVPKSPDLDQLQQRFTAKLERLLTVFQPELVQLHGRLVKNTSREGVVCTLNLRLPTGQFTAEESAGTAQAALRAAGEELVEQIKAHKERLHNEQIRRGQIRRERLRSGAVYGVGPAVEVEEEVTVESAAAQEQRRHDLSRYISANIGHLRRFVERQIQLRERLGELRPGQLETTEVLDEMIASALSERGNPERLERERWFYLLAVNAIRRLSSPAGEEPELSLEGDVPLDETTLAERQEYFQPDDEVRLQDITPDRGMATPEEIAYSNEMLTLLEAALEQLTLQQREDLVLFALEGFTVGELALLSQRRPEEIRNTLRSARSKLSEQKNLPAELRRLLLEQTEPRLARIS